MDEPILPAEWKKRPDNPSRTSCHSDNRARLSDLPLEARLRLATVRLASNQGPLLLPARQMLDIISSPSVQLSADETLFVDALTRLANSADVCDNPALGTVMNRDAQGCLQSSAARVLSVCSRCLCSLLIVTAWSSCPPRAAPQLGFCTAHRTPASLRDEWAYGESLGALTSFKYP